MDPEEPGEHSLSLLSLRIKSFSWLGIGFLTAIELVAAAGAAAAGGLERRKVMLRRISGSSAQDLTGMAAAAAGARGSGSSAQDSLEDA